jgi:hypothetical protein
MSDDTPEPGCVLKLDDLARRAIAARIREPGGDFYFDVWAWLNPKALRKPKEPREDRPRRRRGR